MKYYALYTSQKLPDSFRLPGVQLFHRVNDNLVLFESTYDLPPLNGEIEPRAKEFCPLLLVRLSSETYSFCGPNDSLGWLDLRVPISQV